METNVSKPFSGINQDNSPQNQPEGSYRFALNTIPESSEGDMEILGNEESNMECAEFPINYIPIGKVYMGDGETAIFLVSTNGERSEIGILDDMCVYETHVNAPLGFKVTHQIDATYRLRRGCERTLYWVDGENNKPRIYNFDKPEDFQNEGGEWDVDNFNLFKTYNTLPVFQKFEILEAGSLKPGSYNMALQYLDEDLNPTEWISTSDTIIIYNDNVDSKPFDNVRGSTNLVTSYQEFGPTGKSIQVTFGNLDKSYPFYRVAIIEATSGTGQITRTIFSSEVSTQINTYTYDGSNGTQEGTVEEIAQFNSTVETARHIEQLENRLVLGNVRGKQINYCALQKYASRIKADLVTEEIILNDVSKENNQKRGLVHTEKVGYMPGEIYAFNIFFIGEGGFVTPGFSIPGRNPGYASLMSSDNELSDTFYTDANSCSNEGYWGYDSQGELLQNKKVRHHRFPLRSEVDKPLLVEELDSSSITRNVLLISINGDVLETYLRTSVEYVVTYEVNGSQFTEQRTLDLNGYDPSLGVIDIEVASNISEILFLSVKELDENNVLVEADVNSGLTYASRITSSTTTTDDSVYKTEIFGIKFSNIDLPLPEDVNGENIIGYHIARAERTNESRTILDTGILTPLLIEEREGVSKFVGHGHLMPEADNLKTDVFALIHPEHRFSNREYTGVTNYIQEGQYVRRRKKVSRLITQDVQPGTSYDPEVNKRRDRDNDGFDLHVVTRNNDLRYEKVLDVFAEGSEIKETFYLNTLFSKSIDDVNNQRKEIYNVSADNKIGIVQLNKEVDMSKFDDRIPYVIMKRDLSNPYANFRVIPYYKENINMALFLQDQGNQITLFNGDSYISSMRYVSSMFYDIRTSDRSRKNGLLNFIVGGLSVLLGVLIAVGTLGLGTPAAIAAIGFGISQIATGIKKEQINKVYGDLYEQGLKDTIDDADTLQMLKNRNPPDDEVQWFSDVLTNVWFESNVNMNWRMGSTLGITDFLNSPGEYNEAELNSYVTEKLTTLDATADGGRNYQGFAKAELYELNPDYKRREKEKVYFHLGIEYDCCSDCIEVFPHRVHNSEQSFQEELTDNYRVFLPNNYTDIEGETGVVTDLFRIQNNLYIHTEEALWHIPQNIQERVTDDIVSFIGTGEFFGIPPRKIVDSNNGGSAGTKHKWATIKTPSGVFFISESEGVVYRFDGNKLKPISSKGLFSWFKENTQLAYNRNYYEQTGRRYPYDNNPSNPFGTGFISTYDSRKERVIFTKKDYLYQDDIASDNTDYEICSEGEELIIFNNYRETIRQREEDGWTFLGIEDCELQFQRIEEETIEVETTVTVPNNTDIHIFFDVSGSFGNIFDRCLMSIDEAVEAWLVNFRIEYPQWSGMLFKYQDPTERWVNYANVIATTTYSGQDLSTKDIIVISFCNESSPVYHANGYLNGITQPTETYLNDYNNFVLNVHPQYNSFIGINYPIVFGQNSGSCSGFVNGNLNSSKEFLKHSIAAVHGTELNPVERLQILPVRNQGFTETEWAQMLINLEQDNPYPDLGLKNFGWVGKWDRSADSEGNVITSQQFNDDIQELLRASSTTINTEVTVPTLGYDTTPGEPLTGFTLLDNSWSISFSLKFDSWTSWHSYLPSFYVNTPNKFYSWLINPSNRQRNLLWLHGKLGFYQNYYGKQYPHVIEYVSVSNPLITRVWDTLRFLTEAKRHDPDMKEFFEERFITYNKMVVYNSNQTSGELNLVPKKQLETTDYLNNQVLGNVTIIDRDEEDWKVNNLRDIRINHSVPIFTKKLVDRQEEYYIDKILNSSSLNPNKSWMELESMRDKYLVIRLKFDNFDDVKLLFNYSVETERQSHR